MSLSKLHYGGMFGKETLDKEFKQICLNFEDRDIKKLILYNTPLNKSLFNSMIEIVLTSALKKYIPRYMGIFSKASIAGVLHLGISDDGFIEGIPWYGDINIEMIKEIISNIFASECLRCVRVDEFEETSEIDTDALDWYKQNVGIKITKLKINNDLMKEQYTEKSKKLKEIIEHNTKLETDFLEYKRQHREWSNTITSYSGKLNNFITDEKLNSELIEFIKGSITDKDYLIFILNFYKNKDNFTKFLSDNESRIKTIYDNPDDPIIWILQFKEAMTAKYTNLKPIRPKYKPVENIYSMFAYHNQNIIPFLYETDTTEDSLTSPETSDELSDKELEMSVISITFTALTNTYIEWRDTIASNWKSRRRCLSPTGDPTCC